VSINESSISKSRKISDDSLKTKLQLMHQEIFGVPISEVELSMVKLSFNNNYSCECCAFSITRTTVGAIARYGTCSELKELELKLSIGEWLVFVNTIYKLHIHEWEKARVEQFGNARFGVAGLDVGVWRLAVSFRSIDENVARIETREYKSMNAAWPNWKEFNAVIDDMVTKIKAKDTSTE